MGGRFRLIAPESAVSELPVTVLGIVLANVLHAVDPPKMVAVRSTAASPRKPSPLYWACDTAALRSVGAPSVRFGAVPDQVRR